MDCFLDFFYGSSAMTSLIYKVARLAHQTFSSHPNNLHFAENFNKLKLLTNQIKKSDVCLSADLIAQDKPFMYNTTEAPVSYIGIFENETITLGIFIIKTGARIPLHDHPGMFGIIRVLHGTVSIQSYSQATNGLLNSAKNSSADKSGGERFTLVKKLPLAFATEESECSILTPEDVNYHEIRAVGGVAAFLDILAPPYDNESRTCHYYREIPRGDIGTSKTPETIDDEGEQCVYLEEISHPHDYWSDSKPYEGPEVEF